MDAGAERSAADLFDGFPETLAICGAVREAVDELGAASVTVSKSQVAFRRRRGFAYIWRPGQYVANPVPAVLSLALPRELASDRFKSVVHPAPRVWMHHLELERPEQVVEWLAEAYVAAG